MASMNYKAAVIYASITGNTTTLATMIYDELIEANIEADLILVNELRMGNLAKYDLVLIGTYSWGNGEIPKAMLSLYQEFENGELSRTVTGVFGTGDKCYPYYCGAVDRFRDMLHVHSDLAVTMKIELMPQKQDKTKCKRFVVKMVERARRLVLVH